MSRPMRAVTLPSRDLAFRRVVEHAIETPLVSDAAALESWLRRVYPAASVRVRELSGETASTWYVYRDGTVRPEVDSAWWTRADAPHARLDRSTGVVIDVNEPLADLLSVPIDEATGHDYLYHVPPEAREAVAVLFETALAVSELRSLVRLRRRGGEAVTLEFRSHTSEHAIDVWFRPVGLIGDLPVLAGPDSRQSAG